MLLAGFAVGVGLPWYIRKPSITNLVYGSHEKQRLDIFLPRDKPGGADVLLHIHGGGWTAGTKKPARIFALILSATATSPPR
jgi:acetyl esterase/lipase